MFCVKIDETGRNTLKEVPSLFNEVKEYFKTVEDVKVYLLERYGKMPSTKSKVYVNKKNGGAKEVGFTTSYWNKDISHNSKSWYQTDWVEVYQENRTPVLL